MDYLLRHRLESLERNLERVKDSKDWMKDVVESLNDEANRKRSAEIIKALYQHVNDFREEVDELMSAEERGETAQAWSDYARVFSESRELFSETIEFIAGIALRDLLAPRVTDDEHERLTAQVYRIADEMLIRAAKITEMKFRTTVLIHPSDVSSTLLHLVRLRFPGWSIWHLPLLAQEYARVVLDQDEVIRTRLAEKTNLNMAGPIWEQLFADAFATYVMGPAYPSVLIYLNLSPTVGHDSGLQRAKVVLELLKHMGEQERKIHQLNLEEGKHPLTKIGRELEEIWDQAVEVANSGAQAGQLTRLNQEQLDQLETFAVHTWQVLNHRYLPVLRYPGKAEVEGWEIANEWANQWLIQLSKNQPLTPPTPVDDANMLRDVLNAGWICRRKMPNQVARLAAVMHKTSQEILAPASEARERQ